MNFVKEYIIQSVVCASNNLRLSTEKIEIVTILRKYFEIEEDIALIVFLMKQKTEFSKFALKLDRLLKYIQNERIDYLKVSETFKEHCHLITHELGAMLDILSTVSVKSLLYELSENKRNFLKSNPGSSGLNLSPTQSKQGTVTEKIKSEIEEPSPAKEQFSFEDFEKKILKPIKTFDAFLNKLPSLNYTEKEINEIADLVKLNADLSANVGFDIIGEMHYTFFKALKLIQAKKIPSTKDTIESLRACLIVIVAVVRRKDVDISKFLRRAETFGRNLTKNTRE